MVSMMAHLKTFAAIVALILGAVGVEAGWGHLFEWRSLGENYKAYYALKLFFSLVLLGAAMFALWERKYPGLHLLAIAGTAVMLAGTQFIALATSSILCSTPG
jgi:hypothetical protein